MRMNTVLIVEDDEDQAYLYASRLEGAYRVVQAVTPRAALDLFVAHQSELPGIFG